MVLAATSRRFRRMDLGDSACIPAYYGVLFRIMATPRTISFRIDSEKVAQLDQIAKAMDRDRSYLLNEAVESYLSEQKRYIAMVEEGREDFRNGVFTPMRKSNAWSVSGSARRSA